MPELPEAEVAKKTAGPCLIGKTIKEVIVARVQSIRTPLLDDVTFSLALKDRRIQSIERRAKALVFQFDNRTAMLFHFKLGARLSCHPGRIRETTGVAINFTDGSAFQFGDLALSEFHVAPLEELEHLRVLKSGIDPLSRSFTPARLRQTISPQKQIKAAITDQNVIGGLGNTYTDEILWNSRLSPFKKASELTEDEWQVLTHEIKRTLREGIKKGGEQSFVDALGNRGRYVTKIHKQAGKPCPRDGHPIEMVRHGRATYWCPECQK
jgi:formamidopyrimidine-DNA glycosylase